MPHSRRFVISMNALRNFPQYFMYLNCDCLLS